MTKKSSPSAKIDFNLIGQLITGLAMELEKVAPPSATDAAKAASRSLRCYLAREISNELWSGKGFHREWKSMRLQFLQQHEPYLSKRHQEIDLEIQSSGTTNVKDIERWAFNDLVEFWAKNSEKIND